jgi:hypothetical protein
MPVQIIQVDERDSTWEDDHPRFRVYLHGSGPESTSGWTATYDVTGADVLQVIDWAQRQAGESLTYAIAIVREDAGRGLVWLVGRDGNDVTHSDVEADTQARMLARRGAPVSVPEADRMPDDIPDPRPRWS